MLSAAVYSRSEDVRIGAVVVAELKFRDIERHVFGADFVEAANDTSLKDAPKAFNRVGMERADNVLLAVVIDRLVIVFVEAPIDFAFIRGEQADLIGNHFADESGCDFTGYMRENASDYVTFAADRTDDRSFS